MRADTLPHLRCPTAGDPLRIVEDVVPVRTREAPYGTEVLEGLLHGRASDAHYPIIAGVAILVPDPLLFIASQFARIVTAATPHISPTMVSYLRGHDIDLFGSESGDSWSLLRNNHLVRGHYDPPPAPPANGPASRPADEHDWYDALTNLPDTHIQATDQALDVGCNVGGITYRLARRFRRVVGIDTDFDAVLLARSILLHQPVAQRSYRRPIEGIVYEQRPLTVVPPTNVEIVLADAFSLPFERGSFDLVTTANVLEVVEDPRGLVSTASDALRDRGLLLLTATYSWGSPPSDRWIGGKPGDPGVEAMRRLLADRFEILEDRPAIPQIVWWNDRVFATYLTHQILARALD